MAKKKKAPAIFSTIEFFGNEVVLYDQTWNIHILDPVEGHPAMAGYENLVKQVLKNPYEVYEGSYPKSAVFISDPGLGPSPEGIRVAVEYADLAIEKGATSGFVTTAYPINTVLYPSPRLRRKIFGSGR